MLEFSRIQQDIYCSGGVVFCGGGGGVVFKFLIRKWFFRHCIVLYVLQWSNKRTSKPKPVLLFSSLFPPLLPSSLLFSPPSPGPGPGCAKQYTDDAGGICTTCSQMPRLYVAHKNTVLLPVTHTRVCMYMLAQGSSAASQGGLFFFLHLLYLFFLNSHSRTREYQQGRLQRGVSGCWQDAFKYPFIT